MPAFRRLLVLSALSLSVSVQAAPLETVESRELSHVSRSAEPDVVPEYDDGEAVGFERRGRRGFHKHRKGKGKGKGSRRPASTNPPPPPEARELEEDTVESRSLTEYD